jgi:hypothetical protein
MDLRRSHITVFVFKEKTAQPEPNQARRLDKNGVDFCISCESVSRINFILRRVRDRQIGTFQITHFQSRKVHENLVGAQPAR